MIFRDSKEITVTFEEAVGLAGDREDWPTLVNAPCGYTLLHGNMDDDVFFLHGLMAKQIY